MEELVADGLITMHMEKHANDYIQRMADEAIYEQSPYSQYQKAADCKRTPVARCHNFAPATFRIPHYCDYCRNFMWGLVQQVNLIMFASFSFIFVPFYFFFAYCLIFEGVRANVYIA